MAIVKKQFDPDDYYVTRNSLFTDLPQYHFDRCEMEEVFNSEFLDWYWDHLYESSDSFKLHQDGDEHYIIHFPSGTIVNWYKHVGRCNTCNKNLTIDDLKEFKKMLLDDFGYEEEKADER